MHKLEVSQIPATSPLAPASPTVCSVFGVECRAVATAGLERADRGNWFAGVGGVGVMDSVALWSAVRDARLSRRQLDHHRRTLPQTPPQDSGTPAATSGCHLRTQPDAIS